MNSTGLIHATQHPTIHVVQTCNLEQLAASYKNIQPVVIPVVQPAWQPVVSCKRGLSTDWLHHRELDRLVLNTFTLHELIWRSQFWTKFSSVQLARCEPVFITVTILCILARHNLNPYIPLRAWRSSSSTNLRVTRINLSSDSRSFPIAAPVIWNSLTPHSLITNLWFVPKVPQNAFVWICF